MEKGNNHSIENIRNMGKFIHSTRLLNYYKKGQLDNILKKFHQQINDQNFLGAGDDASTFLYNDDQVMKISTKQSRYFQKFKKNQGAEFKKHINNFKPYFLPVEDILYEDHNILIYTQKFCPKIKRGKITKKDVLLIFQMVRLMFDENCIITDIGVHNIGIDSLNNRPVLFDYHSLQPIIINGQMTDDVNWHRLGFNLTLYMAFIYAPKKITEYQQLVKNLKEKSIKIINKDHLLPSCQIILLKYLMTKKDVKFKKIIQKLDHCIYHLSH